MARWSSDPTCPICSKPVRSGGFVQSTDGEFFHLTCRSWYLQLRALEQVDRAKAAKDRAAQVLDETVRRQVARVRRRETSHRPLASTCPLCAYPATLTDWRPETEWIVVEQCPCQGFSVWAAIIERGRALPAQDRPDFARRVRAFRVRHEAWVTTTDGEVGGPVVLQTRRPDRPA